MEFSKRLRKDLRDRTRRNVRAEARADREIDKSCDRYLRWVDREKARGNDPLTIIVEGDSWMRYPVGKSVSHYLEKLLKTELMNLALFGDEVRDMLSLKQRKRLIRELKRGPARRQKYDFMVFSGGGNDLVGADRFHRWLNHYKPGMTARKILNKKAIKSAFDLLEQGYQEIIDIRDAHSPKTHILLNAYDFAIPDGSGVCGKGPWLKPGLELRKIPSKLRREVVTLFLKDFDKLLRKIANANKNITVINTQGILEDKDWSNELHPKNSGFKKIAKEFIAEIDRQREAAS